jgi:WD40 repeat protein
LIQEQKSEATVRSGRKKFFSESYYTLISGSDENNVKVWDLSNPPCSKTLHHDISVVARQKITSCIHVLLEIFESGI